MKKKISAREFYQLVLSKDQAEINRISGIYIKRLSGYLKIVQGADHEIASDCAQQAFEKVYTKLRDGSISNIENIYSYLIQTVKNEYYMILRKKNIEIPREQEELQRIKGYTAAEVAVNLDVDDKEKVLKRCVEKMRKDRRNFYWDMLRLINESDAIAAKSLNMSHGSFRTRKFRLIEALKDCVKKMGF